MPPTVPPRAAHIANEIFYRFQGNGPKPMVNAALEVSTCDDECERRAGAG